MNAQTYIFAFTITLMSVYNKYIVFMFGIEYEILLNCVVFFDGRFDKSILLKTFKFQRLFNKKQSYIKKLTHLKY